MKFGQYLQQHLFPPWKNEYIQYDHMKYFLKEQQLTRGWTQQDEDYFADVLIANELDKVNAFIHLKTKQIRSFRHQESEQDISQNINDLIEYIELNASGFQKILKKHDKWTGISLQYCIRFRNIQPHFEASIQQLNEILNNYRAEIPRTNSEKKVKIKTVKYWIHPDNLTEVQAILLFHLPTVQQCNTAGASIINTVYFDNPTRFNLYSELLERNESAQTIRAKWYGFISNTSTVYIERKTHYESWLHNKGLYVKERFELPMSQVSDYVSNGPHFGDQHLALAINIHDKIQKDELRSTLRCYHHRTTYQSNPSLRISLDTNLAFMKEMDPLTWRRNDISDNYPFNHLHPHEVYLFPYAVLETKMIGSDPVPGWLTSLIESQLVYEVPYFSKYLHGISHFFRASLPMLPWWLGELEIDIRRKAGSATMTNQQSADFVQQKGCITIEPPLLPDYFGAAPIEQRLSKGSEDNEKLYNNTSSCTVIEPSHIGLVNHHTRTTDDTRFSAYDSLFNSSIMDKIKSLKEAYYEETKYEEDHVSMVSWLYAKITNNKALLLSSSQQQIIPKKGKFKKKVEPKLFFANERTFISWLQFSALLLSVSLGLVNFGDHISKASGGFFILIAVVLAGYAQLRFQYRAWQIRFRSESRFDDTYGPALLCFVLVIALIVNLALRVNQPLPTNPSLFSYNISVSDDLNGIISNTTQQIITNHHSPNGTKLDKHGRIVHEEEEEEEEDEDEPDEA